MLTKKQVEEILREDFIWQGNAIIHDDLTVSMSSHCVIAEHVEKFRIKFRRAGGLFACSRSKITSLHGSPQHVDGEFSCSNTSITSLEGGPTYVGRAYNCAHTQITGLRGAATFVGGLFDCSQTEITSLSDAPESIGGTFYTTYTPNLGLLFAPTINCRSFFISNHTAKNIMNKYCGGGPSAALAMAIDLINEGYVSNARF